MFHSINLAEVKLWPCLLLPNFVCLFVCFVRHLWRLALLSPWIAPFSRVFGSDTYAEERNTFVRAIFHSVPTFLTPFLSPPLTVSLSKWTISNRFLTPCEAQRPQTVSMYHITRHPWSPFLTFHMYIQPPCWSLNHKDKMNTRGEEGILIQQRIPRHKPGKKNFKNR